MVKNPSNGIVVSKKRNRNRDGRNFFRARNRKSQLLPTGKTLMELWEEISGVPGGWSTTYKLLAEIAIRVIPEVIMGM
jgi:hypothetical protein